MLVHNKILLVLFITLALVACGEKSPAEPESAAPTVPADSSQADVVEPTEEPTLAPTEPPEPTQAPTVESTAPPTPVPSPTALSLDAADHTIANGGNIRSEPVIEANTVIGQVCPGDQVATLETQGNWVRVQLVGPAANCVAERISLGTEGWVSNSLMIPHQQPSQSDYPAMPTELTAAIVTNVVDGDTIDVTINGVEQRIRMIGIDTPETKHPSKPVECFGREASAKSTELLQGQVVLLESDASQGDADQYGRLLRFVWLLNGTLINNDLIAQGYAFEYTYNQPYTYQAQFQRAQQTAREQQQGLWAASACNGERKAAVQPTNTPAPKPLVAAPAVVKKIPCPQDPRPSTWANTPIKIVKVDKKAEVVTLQNVSGNPISLNNWTMCSFRGQQEHPISGNIQPGETRTFRKSGENIWNNMKEDNGGLYNSAGVLISYWRN